MLTPKQKIVLEMAADGHPAKRIGDRIGVTKKWAETLLSQARTALGARNTAQAVAIAIRTGAIK